MKKFICLLAVLLLVVGCENDSVLPESGSKQEEAKNLSDVELNSSDAAKSRQSQAEAIADSMSDVVDTIEKGAENVAKDISEGAKTIKKGLDNTIKDLNTPKEPPQNQD